MLKAVTTFLCAASLACAADGIRVERDGHFWKVQVSGTIPTSLTRIVAQSDLQVRGTRPATTSYIVAARVNATSEAQARQFAQGLATLRVNGGVAIFGGPGHVQVDIPRSTRRLSLASEEGDVDAADIEGSVAAQTVAGRITLDRISGDVEVRSSGGPVSLGKIGGAVRCYSGGGGIRAIRLDRQALFESSGGDIVVGEVRGPIRAITLGGGIRIDQAGSQVFAGTSGGPIAILRAMGLVVAQTSAGPIEIGSAPSVECQTGGGTIRLSNMSGAMRATTDRGTVIAQVIAGRPLTDSFLATAAGDIIVILPSDIGVTVDAETSGTRMTSAIVSDYPGLQSVSGRSTVTARGAINGGGPKLRLRAAEGRIEIRRK